MWIKEFNGNVDTRSETYEVNLLFKQDKFYIMDNHLCAAWCWLQETDKANRYNLFHIDRHYDLLDNKTLLKDYLAKRSIDLFSISFEEYVGLVDEEMKNELEPGRPYPLFRYDNYIMFMIRAFPGLIDLKYFATHEDGTIPKDLEIDYRPRIYEVFDNIHYWLNDEYINEVTGQWILNLDVDYFFQGNTKEDE